MATKTKKKKTVKASDLSYASAVADQTIGPQVSEIKGLYDQAKSQYASDIDAAKNAAISARGYAQAAQAPTRTNYDTAAAAAKINAGDVNAAFQNIGSAADAFKASAAREQGASATKIADERAGAVQSLTDRITGAASGQQYAANQARAAYQKTSDTLSSKLTDLAGQRGNTIAVQLGKLQQDRASRSATKSNSDSTLYTSGAFAGMTKGEVSGLSAAQRQAKVDAYNAKSGKKPKGQSRATADQRNTINTQVSKALKYASGYADQKKPRGQAADDLLRGRPASKDEATGTVYDAIPSFPQLALSIALDQAYDGHVSAKNAKKLHSLGYKVADITDVMSQTQVVQRGRKLNRPGKAPRNGTAGSPFT